MMTAPSPLPPATSIPIAVDDPTNARLLAVSEDRIRGFTVTPFEDIAELSGLSIETVLLRVRAMLGAGVIRRVRLTVMSTNLAPGALVAWRFPPERLEAAFDFMAKRDPFSGHVVIRSTDADTPGSAYRLWTTLKVPQGFSMQRHAEVLAAKVGAAGFRLMPAEKMFTLGVGHVRRRSVEPGEMSDEPGEVIATDIVPLTDREWRVLPALKRELEVDEVATDLWERRAAEAGLSPEEFLSTARGLDEKGVIGRFSTFLEHTKRVAGQPRVTRFNALFHWRVPEGRQLEAGREVGRFHIMTHAYWREGGPEFGNVNVMGVAHGLDKAKLLEHKSAIDRHLASRGMEVSYTNVFWGGRSEIKPSEILPGAYEAWCESMGVEVETMRA